MKKTIFLMLTTALFYIAVNCCGCGNCSKASILPGTTTAYMATAHMQSLTLKVTGMSCPGCANTIDNALSKKKGIISKKVEYPGDRAIIQYDPTLISPDEIIKIIEKAGYKAGKLDNTEASHSKEKCNGHCKGHCKH